AAGGTRDVPPEGCERGAGTGACSAADIPTAPLRDFTATIDWGDSSTPSAGTITQPGGTGTDFVVSGNHTYTEEGASFAITVDITDVGGSTASAASSASVADATLTATGGFIVIGTPRADNRSQNMAPLTD